MSRKFALAFSIVALCSLLATVVYFVGSLYTETRRGTQNSQETFTRVRTQVTSFLDRSTVNTQLTSVERQNSTHTALISRALEAEIAKIARSNPSIAAISISSPQGIELAYPLSSSFLLYDASGIPHIESSSPLVQMYNSPLHINNLSMTAVMYTLQPVSIYYYGRNAFLIILAITLLTFIFLLATSVFAPEKPTSEIAPDDNDIDRSADISFKPLSTHKVDSVDDISTPEDDVSVLETHFAYPAGKDTDLNEFSLSDDDAIIEMRCEKHHIGFPPINDEAFDLPDFNDEPDPVPPLDVKTKPTLEDYLLADYPPDTVSDFDDIFYEEDEKLPFENNTSKPLTQPTIKSESIASDSFEDSVQKSKTDEAILSEPLRDSDAVVPTNTKKPALDPKIDPTGLFSEKTGVGWESYFETRLDAELGRAASGEQDLAVMMCQIPGVTHDNLLSRKIAYVMIEYFNFRDLVFEYGTDGFVGILQNCSLDSAMRVAESVLTEIQMLCKEAHVSVRTGIGISTRALRLLPALRLIDEAKEALIKATTEDGLPIVAFKADTEKYRQYIAEKYNKQR